MANLYLSLLAKVFEAQVGYLEKETNKDLDNATKNAGDENFTKYARDYAEFAKVNLQGNPWCDMFVDWCFVKAYGKENAAKLLGGFDAYTPNSAKNFKNMGRWYTKNPQRGDIVFFKNAERINHTGWVYKVDATHFYTIEGNTSSGPDVVPNGGAVCYKKYPHNLPKLAGFGRPAYDPEPVTKPSTPVAPVVKPIAVYVPSKSITAKSPKKDILWLQKKLNVFFKNDKSVIKLVEDSDYGNKTAGTALKFIKAKIDPKTKLNGRVFDLAAVKLLNSLCK